jgi:hypothetical protein
VFNNSKYTRWYCSIIAVADALQPIRTSSPTKYHKHHIVPKSLGGDDAPENIVLLTLREHYVCHLLLVKMTDGVARSKMVFAFFRFSPKGLNVRSSRSFERFASSFGKTLSGAGNPFYGRKHTAATIAKLSGKNHPMYGTNLKELWRKKYGDEIAEQRETARLAYMREIRRTKPRAKVHKTQAQCDHQAEMMRGARNPNFGKDWCFVTKQGMNKKVERHTLDTFLADGWIRGVERKQKTLRPTQDGSPSDR